MTDRKSKKTARARRSWKVWLSANQANALRKGNLIVGVMAFHVPQDRKERAKGPWPKMVPFTITLSPRKKERKS